MAKGQQKKTKEAKKPKKKPTPAIRPALALNRSSDRERVKDIADLLMFGVSRLIGSTSPGLK